MRLVRPLLLGGKWVQGERAAEIRSPFDGRVVASVAQASRAQADEAIAFAFAARERLAAQSVAKRREVLRGIAAGLLRRQEELIDAIVSEAGKPLKAARTEVSRAVQTYTLAADELSRFGGEVVPVDLDPAAAGYTCEVRRFPAGVVVGIVPFNFPLNLGAHKVAPALAVGAPVIVKPPPQAPSAQLIAAELALESGADPAALQVLPCDNAVAEALATNERVRIVSFTGSAKVGWMLKNKVAAKAVLELGGNAAVIVCEDAALDWAAERCALGGFNYAGQVCIKVQRIFVEERVYEPFVAKLVEWARKVGVGDPAEETTVVGPVIDDRAAERISDWLQEAVSAGAKVLCGGTRKGRMIAPTVLADVPVNVKASTEEIFGPVIGVARVKSFDDALRSVNATAYGLQAGVFTNDLRKSRRAFMELEVGGVIVNDYPTFRSDNMPYGGSKASGLGREGVRYAMNDYTEERAFVVRTA